MGLPWYSDTRASVCMDALSVLFCDIYEWLIARRVGLL